jgi:amino acid transporter
MVAFLPLPGGHIKLAERFVDPAFSFTMGWNYWYFLTIALPAELSAAAVLFGFWNHHISAAVWITICLVVVIAINLLGAGAYGEAEFWFASIKVITITGLIILGIVLDLGGGPNHDRLGFRYWKHPGPFVQYAGIPGSKGRFLGFWAVMIQAAFSIVGTEMVAIAAGETKNPRRNLTRAIKRVYIRKFFPSNRCA